MITVESFRQKIRESQSVSVLDEVLLAPAAIHVATRDIEHIKTALVGKFDAATTTVEIWVIGSAKLGFSITEKRLPDGTKLPRYRTFSPTSDVDIAVVSSSIFELIWNELSIHAYQSPRLPWKSGALGDYLIGGWLRPDHFPKGVRLRRCDDWWDLFRSLSADARFGRRKIRGALFHSMDHVKRYLIRALNECSLAENLNA
jgi:hypothetical protein